MGTFLPVLPVTIPEEHHDADDGSCSKKTCSLGNHPCAEGAGRSSRVQCVCQRLSLKTAAGRPPVSQAWIGTGFANVFRQRGAPHACKCSGPGRGLSTTWLRRAHGARPLLQSCARSWIATQSVCSRRANRIDSHRYAKRVDADRMPHCPACGWKDHFR